MAERLVNLGYQKGLTLYATPYDWRRTTLGNKIKILLNETLEQIYDLTGKPAVLVAHSLGNLGVLSYLNSLPYEVKEKFVSNFVAVVGPWQESRWPLATLLEGTQILFGKTLVSISKHREP